MTSSSAPPARARLDEEVVARRLADTRSRARALILAGDVLVNGRPSTRAGVPVDPTDFIELRPKPRFVSRGGEKLAHAIAAFGIDPAGLAAADLGASTGGFTDCLLQAGAAHVVAVDVGYGQLATPLRGDPRVTILDRTNARNLTLDDLPLAGPLDLVVVDVSFISLRLILPVAARLLRPSGACVPLIKPQFEAGRDDVGKNGVVRDPAVHRRVLRGTLAAAQESGFGVQALTRSPLVGPAGNVEFLAHLLLETPSRSLDALVDGALAETPS